LIAKFNQSDRDHAEGEAATARSIAKYLFTKKPGNLLTDLQVQIDELSINLICSFVYALFDFNSIDDLKPWLVN
jgi:Domain of unknown function (DUF4351)